MKLTMSCHNLYLIEEKNCQKLFNLHTFFVKRTDDLFISHVHSPGTILPSIEP